MNDKSQQSGPQERTRISDRIKLSRLVVVIRFSQRGFAADVIDSLFEGGVPVVEVTSNTPGYCDDIRKARAAYPEKLIGAGTIKNAELAREAVDAGAQFLVTPNVSKEVVEVAHVNEIPVLMGAFTPTEINLALDYGADLIKIFPSGGFGIDYFRSLQGPFDEADLFAVGGIKRDEFQEWFNAGAAGIGVGGELITAVLSKEEKAARIELARTYVDAAAPPWRSCNDLK